MILPSQFTWTDELAGFGTLTERQSPIRPDLLAAVADAILVLVRHRVGAGLDALGPGGPGLLAPGQASGAGGTLLVRRVPVRALRTHLVAPQAICVLSAGLADVALSHAGPRVRVPVALLATEGCLAALTFISLGIPEGGFLVNLDAGEAERAFLSGVRAGHALLRLSVPEGLCLVRFLTCLAGLALGRSKSGRALCHAVPEGGVPVGPLPPVQVGAAHALLGVRVPVRAFGRALAADAVLVREESLCRTLAHAPVLRLVEEWLGPRGPHAAAHAARPVEVRVAGVLARAGRADAGGLTAGC